MIRDLLRSCTRHALPSFVATLVLATLFVSPPADAQRDAVIAGRVVDVDGNPVTGAVIVVTSADRGDSRELRTDDEGNFMGRGFRPAENYVVQVQAEGFAGMQQDLRTSLGTNTADFTLPRADPNAGVDYEALNALYDEGFKAWQAQDWPEAERLMVELLDGMATLVGDDVETMRRSATEVLGVAYLEQGQHDASIATFESLLEMDPDSLTAHTWLGQGYTRKGDYETAAPHLRRAAELAPDSPEVQYNAGAVLLQIGEVEDGIAAMERSIELRPDFPVARKNLAYAYLRVEKYAEAIAMLESYLELSPDAPDRADIEGMIEALKAQIQ